MSDRRDQHPTSTSPIGHNSGDKRQRTAEEIAARRTEHVGAFLAFVANRRADRELAQSEIKMLPAMRRLTALRLSGLLSQASYYRRNKNADVAPGLIAAFSALADDERYGAATMSTNRLAAFLGRSRRAIFDAINRLEQQGLVRVVRKTGFASAYVPSVPRVFAEDDWQIVWLFDALAPRVLAPGERDAPPKTEVAP